MEAFHRPRNGVMRPIFRIGLLLIGLGLLAAWVLPHMLRAAEVTDALVIDGVVEIVGMFGLGLPGYALALGILAFMMKLTKWGRVRSVFHVMPKQYRSLIPLMLGAAIGFVDGLSTGLPLLQAVVKGVVAVGGGQLLVYEQVKGTGLGYVIEAVTSFIPKAQERRAS